MLFLLGIDSGIVWYAGVYLGSGTDGNCVAFYGLALHNYERRKKYVLTILVCLIYNVCIKKKKITVSAMVDLSEERTT